MSSSLHFHKIIWRVKSENFLAIQYVHTSTRVGGETVRNCGSAGELCVFDCLAIKLMLTMYFQLKTTHPIKELVKSSPILVLSLYTLFMYCWNGQQLSNKVR